MGLLTTVKPPALRERYDGVVNGTPAILLIVWRQPGANILATVDRVRALLPQLQADIPPTVRLINAVDRTLTIRASVHEVQRTLGLSVLLVILVVFVFFRTLRTALIPSVVVPVCSSAPSAPCISSATASTTCRSWR